MRSTFASFFRTKRGERTAVWGFFGLTLLIGLLSFRDFGIATDEGTMDSLGLEAHAYVFSGAEWPTNPAWRYHGTAVELPLMILQDLFTARGDITTVHRRIFTQHLSVFLLFFGGMVALFVFAKQHFGNWRWALLCAAMLFLTPRFFAHAFYNSRDIPEVTFFTVAMLTLVRAADRRTIRSMLLHGAATALALALRMPALILLGLTALWFAHWTWLRWSNGEALEARRSGLLLAVYGACTALLTIAFWPFLWEQPIAHFWEAYRFMSSLGGPTTFMGTAYPQTPWQYVPVWMLITIPLAYTALFLCGATSLLLSVRNLKQSLKTRGQEWLVFAWCVLPVLSVIVTGAGIYNEWRHVFFIYPAFLLVAVMGLKRLAASGLLVKRIALGVTALQLVLTGLWMIRNHPFPFAYYSLPASFIQNHVQPGRTDYWGLSYYEAMRHVFATSKGIISVYSPENIAYQNAFNMFPEELSRVMRVPSAGEAMFVVVSDPADAQGLPLLKAFTVDGVFLSGIYKGRVKEVLIDRATGSVSFGL